MFLREKSSGDVVEVTGLADLFDPCAPAIRGRFHAGEEMQDEESFSKTRLVFPSGESLPRCWTDAEYRS